MSDRQTLSPASYEERYRLLQNLYDELFSQMEQLRVENQRLHDALERLTTIQPSNDDEWTTAGFALLVRDIARAALNGTLSEDAEVRALSEEDDQPSPDPKPAAYPLTARSLAQQEVVEIDNEADRLLREAKNPDGSRRFYPPGLHRATHRYRAHWEQLSRLPESQERDEAMEHIELELAKFEKGEDEAKRQYLRAHGIET